MDIFQHQDFHLLTVSQHLLVSAEGPVSCISVEVGLHWSTRLEISDLEFQMFVVVLDVDFAQIEVTMHQSRVVRCVKTCRHLDSHIEDKLSVLSWHIEWQVQLKRVNIVEHIATIGQLGHLEVEARLLVHKLLERSDNIGVGIHVDPLGDVLSGWDLSDHEILAEIFVVDNETRLRNDLLHLTKDSL
jgi:hypothetical protein